MDFVYAIDRVPTYYARMGDVRKLDTSKPRKMRETTWSDEGLRLAPSSKITQSDWFWPAVLTLPVGAFLIILFW